ncbi:FAD-dependent oxidoreductase [Streptomyces mashuensis]|uniref:FAD-dependent oxidoreductase n=1 Tax=Streptomyces mashuensis TaxID=33904 RepID=A0A919EDR0_9ACTN|nr:FAD-dependent monooxygenase [Streptomyces mashuensis]GHF47394.1 FAD-dependent oxidoreductase [Streptomyces mashuensis]
MPTVSTERADRTEEPLTDVVVVGAGPTGLLLAGDLAAAGVRVVLLERRAEESNLTRAFAVHARSLELLDARGLAEPLLATGTFLRGARLFGRLRVDLGGLDTRFPGVLVTPQYETERLLEERARACGADIRRGVRVTGLRQDADGVDVEFRAPGTADNSSDDATATLRARYVVGADGVRSAVREAIGMPFPGRAVLRSVMLADVRLDTAPAKTLAFNSGVEGFCLIVPFGDGWYRVIAWERGREEPVDAPVDMDRLRALTRAVFGTDFGMGETRWTSRFHSDERQVPRYRSGRVLLAGDAAHVHSPAGGLGMNAGLQDAANLGWKLAAVLAGRDGDALLDTYHDERHPIGTKVLRVSHALVRGALVTSPAARALRGVVGSAARFAPFATRRVAGFVSGIGIRYPAPPGSHPLTGRRAPDLALAETTDGPVRLYEALRAGTYVRVLPRGAKPVPEAGVTTVTRADADTTTLLVRPDGYIAEASEGPAVM